MATTPQSEQTPAPEAKQAPPEQSAEPKLPNAQDVAAYRALEERVRAEYEGKFQLWKRSELAEMELKMDDKVRDGLAQFYEQWKTEQQPLTKEQIEQLTSQEYGEFKVKLQTEKEDGTMEDVIVVLRELPQSVERKFYRQFKNRLQKYGPEIAAFTQANMGQPFEKVLQAFLDTFDNAFDILADAVSMCIDPKEKKGWDTKWVQDNISSSRQWNIIKAQMEVNRLRDFFSQLYQAGQKAQTMTTGPSFQGLLQQLR